MKENKGLLTLGGVVGIAIVSSFVIRAYLDLLRIKRLKQEIKTKSGGNTDLMGNEE
tara:strand:+ start:278 stop:445 length:168 start_codon:yes stop_codon:yes gene_type:complete